MFMEPDIGLEKSSKVINFLNGSLADLFVLGTKTKKYHWNLTGPRFHTLHVLFQEHYETIDEHIDEVAERITSLGGLAIGTLEEFQKASQLEEHPEEIPDEDGILEDLLTDHETLIKTLRKNIKISQDCEDEGTADLLIGILRFHEKTSWMLRSYFNE